MDELDVVAVYGSLRHGQASEHRLAGATYLGSGSVAGALFDVRPGPGHAFPFPAFRPGDDGLVVVELYQLPDDASLGELDAYEGYDSAREAGCQYVRRPVDIRSGPVDRAWIYVHRGPDDELGERIAHGDWVAFRAGRVAR